MGIHILALIIISTGPILFPSSLTPRLIVSWGLNGHLSYPCDLNLLIQQFHISSLNTAYESGISKFIEDLVYAKCFTYHFILYYPSCYYLYFTDDSSEPQILNDLFKALTLNSMFFPTTQWSWPWITIYHCASQTTEVFMPSFTYVLLNLQVWVAGPVLNTTDTIPPVRRFNRHLQFKALNVTMVLSQVKTQS